jgi:hypothetical protein
MTARRIFFWEVGRRLHGTVSYYIYILNEIWVFTLILILSYHIIFSELVGSGVVKTRRMSTCIY